MTPDFISNYFPKGADVEVSQTQPGFPCSWYPATVIKHDTNVGKSGSYSTAIVVEYKTLKENDDLDACYLREAVSPSQLRPIPPSKGRGFVFGVGDSVDVDRYGGWWEGVITGVLIGDSKYVVFIRGSREEMEFEGSMLRVHREWVKGRWVPDLLEEESGGGSCGDGECSGGGGGGGGEESTDLEPLLSHEEHMQNNKERPLSPDVRTQNNKESSLSPEDCTQNNKEPPLSPEERMQNNKEPPLSPEERMQNNKEPPLSPEDRTQNNIFKHTFSPGDLVEVSNDEEGLEGSWFTATIVKRLSETKYLIEYLNLKDEDGKDPLREEVNLQNLRPCPPVLEYINRFEAFERVDARYNGGWWEGVIRRVLIEDRYSVYFPNSDELLKFQEEDLRIHHEWENGTWVIPPKVPKV